MANMKETTKEYKIHKAWSDDLKQAIECITTKKLEPIVNALKDIVDTGKRDNIFLDPAAKTTIQTTAIKDYLSTAFKFKYIKYDITGYDKTTETFTGSLVHRSIMHPIDIPTGLGLTTPAEETAYISALLFNLAAVYGKQLWDAGEKLIILQDVNDKDKKFIYMLNQFAHADIGKMGDVETSYAASNPGFTAPDPLQVNPTSGTGTYASSTNEYYFVKIAELPMVFGSNLATSTDITNALTQASTQADTNLVGAFDSVSGASSSDPASAVNNLWAFLKQQTNSWTGKNDFDPDKLTIGSVKFYEAITNFFTGSNFQIPTRDLLAKRENVGTGTNNGDILTTTTFDISHFNINKETESLIQAEWNGQMYSESPSDQDLTFGDDGTHLTTFSFAEVQDADWLDTIDTINEASMNFFIPSLAKQIAGTALDKVADKAVEADVTTATPGSENKWVSAELFRKKIQELNLNIVTDKQVEWDAGSSTEAPSIDLVKKNLDSELSTRDKNINRLLELILGKEMADPITMIYNRDSVPLVLNTDFTGHVFKEGEEYFFKGKSYPDSQTIANAKEFVSVIPVKDGVTHAQGTEVDADLPIIGDGTVKLVMWLDTAGNIHKGETSEIGGKHTWDTNNTLHVVEGHLYEGSNDDSSSGGSTGGVTGGVNPGSNLTTWDIEHIAEAARIPIQRTVRGTGTNNKLTALGTAALRNGNVIERFPIDVTQTAITAGIINGVQYTGCQKIDYVNAFDALGKAEAPFLPASAIAQSEQVIGMAYHFYSSDSGASFARSYRVVVTHAGTGIKDANIQFEIQADGKIKVYTNIINCILQKCWKPVANGNFMSTPNENEWVDVPWDSEIVDYTDLIPFGATIKDNLQSFTLWLDRDIATTQQDINLYQIDTYALPDEVQENNDKKFDKLEDEKVGETKYTTEQLIQDNRLDALEAAASTTPVRKIFKFGDINDGGTKTNLFAANLEKGDFVSMLRGGVELDGVVVDKGATNPGNDKFLIMAVKTRTKDENKIVVNDYRFYVDEAGSTSFLNDPAHIEINPAHQSQVQQDITDLQNDLADLGAAGATDKFTVDTVQDPSHKMMTWDFRTTYPGHTSDTEPLWVSTEFGTGGGTPFLNEYPHFALLTDLQAQEWSYIQVGSLGTIGVKRGYTNTHMYLITDTALDPATELTVHQLFKGGTPGTGTTSGSGTTHYIKGLNISYASRANPYELTDTILDGLETGKTIDDIDQIWANFTSLNNAAVKNAKVNLIYDGMWLDDLKNNSSHGNVKDTSMDAFAANFDILKQVRIEVPVAHTSIKISLPTPTQYDANTRATNNYGKISMLKVVFK